MYIEVKDLKKVMAPVIVKCRCCVALQRKWSKGKCALFKERVVLVNPRY